MEKSQRIAPNRIAFDKDSKTDELRIVAGTNGNYDVVQGKRAKELIVTADEGVVNIKSKSKFLWTTDDVKVKDKDGNIIKVESTKEGISFPAAADTTYLVTVVHKFRVGLIVLLVIAGLVGSTVPKFLSRPPEPAVVEAPVGNFKVGAKQEQAAAEETPEEAKTITFSGYGTYTVSKDAPNVELSNPEGNFVNMQFTLTDDLTGDVIARTNLVAPGNYVYANVMEYYKDKTGEFDVTVNISTYTDDGQQMNGVNEAMKLIIE